MKSKPKPLGPLFAADDAIALAKTRAEIENEKRAAKAAREAIKKMKGKK
jgi:hypothetical protein